jgi:hypothetical protein
VAEAVVPQTLQIRLRRLAVRVRNQPCVARRGLWFPSLEAQEAFEQQDCGRRSVFMPGLRRRRPERGGSTSIESAGHDLAGSRSLIETWNRTSTVNEGSAGGEADRLRWVANAGRVSSPAAPGLGQGPCWS